MRLEIFTPLFTGPAAPKGELAGRYKQWVDWFENRDHTGLKRLCADGVFIQAYAPGTEVVIPDERDEGRIHVAFSANAGGQTPKGVVGRLHLLKILTAAERNGWDFAQTIFGCIDGSGAFDFDSLEMLAEPFAEDSKTEIVLGRRPNDCCGMTPGRKELEQFEQYLLFLHRPREMARAFGKEAARARRLQDGQTGCWAFRLTAASRLALTSSGYMEYDMLASAVESGLRIAHTRPLRMSRQPRHSTASANPVRWSMGKLQFIERKLRIPRAEIADAWRRFNAEFAGTEMLRRIPKGYGKALLAHCGAGGTRHARS